VERKGFALASLWGGGGGTFPWARNSANRDRKSAQRGRGWGVTKNGGGGGGGGGGGSGGGDGWGSGCDFLGKREERG